MKGYKTKIGIAEASFAMVVKLHCPLIGVKFPYGNQSPKKQQQEPLFSSTGQTKAKKTIAFTTTTLIQRQSNIKENKTKVDKYFSN